jgi:hypothetical protein
MKAVLQLLSIEGSYSNARVVFVQTALKPMPHNSRRLIDKFPYNDEVNDIFTRRSLSRLYHVPHNFHIDLIEIATFEIPHLNITTPKCRTATVSIDFQKELLDNRVCEKRRSQETFKS